MIPGGLTKKLQPLDISVNKPFKGKSRNLCDSFMKEEFRRIGDKKQKLKQRLDEPNLEEVVRKEVENQIQKLKPKRVAYSGLCEWIMKAWNEIDVQTI